MKYLILIALLTLFSCQQVDNTQNNGDDVNGSASSNSKKLNQNFLDPVEFNRIRGDQCLFDKKGTCEIPFQALFSNDIYLGKLVRLRGIFIIQEITNPYTQVKQIHAFLFQSPEHVVLCDPTTAVELLPSNPKEFYQLNKNNIGSYVRLEGELMPRYSLPWRQLTLSRIYGSVHAFSFDGNLFNSAYIKFAESCMSNYTDSVGL